MDQDSLINYIMDTFAGCEVVRPTDGPGAGDTFFFYDPQHNIDPTHRQPFATIVTKDYGDFDKASQLHRPGVFRLNIGVSRETFRNLFGYLPNAERPSGAPYDFAALDQVMPHPTYGRQAWICVLNPSSTTFENIKIWLAEAYEIAAARHRPTRPAAE